MTPMAAMTMTMTGTAPDPAPAPALTLILVVVVPQARIDYIISQCCCRRHHQLHCRLVSDASTTGTIKIVIVIASPHALSYWTTMLSLCSSLELLVWYGNICMSSCVLFPDNY
jgi:hypothetical protein